MKLQLMLLDPHGRALPDLGALRLHGGGDTTVDASWSTDREPPYRSDSCSLIEVVHGSAEVEVDGYWWRLNPGFIHIIPCRRMLRRRTRGMRNRWLCWSAADLAGNIRLGQCAQIIQVDSASHRPWCAVLASAGIPEDARAACLIAGVLLQASACLLGERDITVNQRDPVVDAAIAVLDRHHPQPLPMAKLARAVGCSTSLIHARFAAVLGVTPGAYARERRIHTARELLATTDLAITSIAERCGFADPLHFSRVIRRQCGLSPVALRHRLRRE